MTQFTGPTGAPAQKGDAISLSQLYAAFGTLDGDATATTVKPVGVPGSVTAGTMVVDAHLLRAFGYIGDGNPHPASALFGTLAAAQAAYPSAQALTDEIDGLAIQAAITAAGSRALVLSFPPGSSGRLTRAITSGAGAIHVLGNKSTLLSTTAGQNGWNHGVGQNVFDAYLSIEKLTLECTGVGGVALNTSFSPISGDFRLRDVTITGSGDRNANYWTQAVVGVNASLTDFRSLFITGRPSGLGYGNRDRRLVLKQRLGRLPVCLRHRHPERLEYGFQLRVLRAAGP